MSDWVSIHGTIQVSPVGRTQPEKRYILDTVLEHLPVVSGSEGDMDIYVIQKNGYTTSCSCDEFFQRTDKATDHYGNRSYRRGMFRTQDDYILVVDGSLRDRDFKTSYREFQKWLCRLAKRVCVEDVLVEIKGWDGVDWKSPDYAYDNARWRTEVIRDPNDAYWRMFEDPSWMADNISGEPAWYEYLMWESAKDSSYPLLLAYKYYNDEDVDKEVERRRCKQ